MKTLRVILAAFVIAGVTACGQTGPLYLPNKQRPASSPVPEAGHPASDSQ